MHCLYRPNVMMRTGVISRYLILQIWGERFSGGLGERDTGTASFRCWDGRKFLRNVRRSSEGEQGKKHAHEQQAKADQRA